MLAALEVMSWKLVSPAANRLSSDTDALPVCKAQHACEEVGCPAHGVLEALVSLHRQLRAKAARAHCTLTTGSAAGRHSRQARSHSRMQASTHRWQRPAAQRSGGLGSLPASLEQSRRACLAIDNAQINRMTVTLSESKLEGRLRFHWEV